MSEYETEKARVRSLPSDYIDVQSRSYDPDFISDISKKMQVPERISVGGDAHDMTNNYEPRPQDRGFTQMTVPERIIVAGDNRHIGLREEFRKLPIDSDPRMEMHNYVELETPPHVLTLEQCFPTVHEIEESKAADVEMRPTLNGHIAAPQPYTPGLSPHDPILLNEEDEATLLRTHVAKLTRRITNIEQDNQRRAQRDLMLYSVIMLYVIGKLFSFFRSR